MVQAGIHESRGSCKDRMCLGILQSMESKKMLKPGDGLIEASGGNTAVSLAMISAAKGYSLTIVMPDTVPPERKRLRLPTGRTSCLPRRQTA